MDFSRLRQGEIVAGVAGIALLVIMFLPWFGTGLEAPEVPDVQQIPGVDPGAFEQPEVDESTSGWDSLTDWDGFLIALAGLSGIALVGLAASGRRLNLGDLPRGGGTAVLGGLATLTIVFRLIADPGDGLEYGIFLGLAAAIALTVGALLALREGGFEPLATVAGGRTRAATSSGTTTSRRASSGSRSSSSSSSKSRSGSRSGGSRASGSRSSSSRSRSSSSRGGSRSKK